MTGGPDAGAPKDDGDADAASRDSDDRDETFMTAHEDPRASLDSTASTHTRRRSLAAEIGAAEDDDDDDDDDDNDDDDDGDGSDGDSAGAGDDGDVSDAIADVLSPGLASPSESASIPDDTPSLHGSHVSLPLRATPSPRPSALPRTPSGALQPFERRFSSRFSVSPSPSPRAASPAFLNAHSRQSSVSSQLLSHDGGDAAEALQTPWEVVRWTRLKKITAQAFSEAGKRSFGTPTCLAVSSSIAIGTSKGLILLFDYHQTLKSIIGQGTKAVECGAITSLAIAADYSTVAGGHATGHIFTWELARPAKPFLHIPPVSRSDQGQSPDGHLPLCSVLHIGFLGTRRTALVSADDRGMAFSHLATRGLGAITRSIKTTRLLGRYPSLTSVEESKRKPSSVLAFAPLPLGNVEQATDDMGLTALLTPYLLVIVSTTPIAQTQHKASRPKDISSHGAMSGCLAWFPAVRLKTAKDGRPSSDTKLVYCWSNILTVLDVEVRAPDPTAAKDKPPDLFFHARSRWRCEEAIVAVQWLSRSVIGVLTISQQLVIIEDGDLHLMDSVDLMQKHIYHSDLFSQQLHPVIEQTDNEDSAMHGVVADAFYQSFRVYKGRIFLLGNADVSIGNVSNWADRLTALLEHGDNITAIRLARSYYTGESGGVTVGLPENAQARHAVVHERLLELMEASVKYVFSDEYERGPLRELISECFDSCLVMDEQSYLFDELYEPFKDAGQELLFLEVLEGYIMDDEVTSLPPPVVKDLVDSFVKKGQVSHLEELLCRLDPRTFDIDQITTLCKNYHLYDALIFVWNEALSDYVTPMIDLLSIVRSVTWMEDEADDQTLDSARKVFAYLAFALTGRKYPQGDFIDDDDAEHQKANLYKVLFSHQDISWPPSSSTTFKTRLDDQDEPAFPYVRLLLDFDTASFMSMMSEAFEDSYLNGPQDENSNGMLGSDGVTTNGNGARITRQYIVSILLDIMADDVFAPEDTIYLDMFIARNLPKYPQFMILSGSSLQKVLDRLCSLRSDDLEHDCQLSAEYLLSVYHPPITADLVEQLRDARFYRVLKSLYRGEHRYLDLIKTYFEDPQEKHDLLEDVAYCLRSESSPKQTSQLKSLLYQHAAELAVIDAPQMARTFARYAPDALEPFLGALDDSHSQFVFLRALLEPTLLHGSVGRDSSEAPSDDLTSQFREQYVQLMCVHDPRHVADYVGLLKSGDLRLDRVLPSMESNGVIDAAVLLLAQDGLARDAVDRLCKHMRTLQNAICSLIKAASSSPDVASTEETATDLTEAVDKYARLGIWLCQGQSSAMIQSRRPRHRINAAWDVREDDLHLDELLWLNLIDAVVSLTKSVAAESAQLEDDSDFDTDKISNALRGTVQQTFTALLASTSASSGKSGQHARHQPQSNQSFLYIFRAFLTRASASYAPSLSDLRAVLLDVFSAYAHESSVLSLASSLLNVDVFADINDVHTLRQRGWRPRTQVCETCKRKAWGTGVSVGSEAVWHEWEREEHEKKANKLDKLRNLQIEEADRGKGKRPSVDVVQPRSEDEQAERRRLALVVFACRHVFHRKCLDAQLKTARGAAGDEDAVPPGKYRCLVCEHKR
ncbi:hypothetical protein MBLNU459_g4336t1 [Dothideomycetes sp. NU459]